MRDLIVLEVMEQEKETKKGGLFYQAPKWAKPQNIGKIKQIGPEVKTIEVNGYYYFNPYAVIDTDDKQTKLIRESDILCQMEELAQSSPEA